MRPITSSCAACTHADLDITDAASVVSVVDEFRPDLIINTAAYTAVDKAESNESAARLCNAVGVGNLAAAIARHAGARMVHISTDFVFDGKASSPYRAGSADCAVECLWRHEARR